MKKLGLVLGGGCVKGASFVGVLDTFEKEGISVDKLVGTSMGALVSTFYSAGFSINQLLDILKTYKKGNIFRWRDILTHRHGFTDGKHLMAHIKKELGDIHFEDLSIPLKMTGLNLETGERIVFDKGPMLPALRAAISYPGIFSPVKRNGVTIIDGGITDVIPVDLINKEVDVTIACRVPCHANVHKRKPRDTILHFLGVVRDAQMLVRDELVKTKIALHKPDFVIEPKVSHISDWEVTSQNIDYCFEKGKFETQIHLSKIKESLL